MNLLLTKRDRSKWLEKNPDDVDEWVHWSTYYPHPGRKWSPLTWRRTLACEDPRRSSWDCTEHERYTACPWPVRCGPLIWKELLAPRTKVLIQPDVPLRRSWITQSTSYGSTKFESEGLGAKGRPFLNSTYTPCSIHRNTLVEEKLCGIFHLQSGGVKHSWYPWGHIPNSLSWELETSTRCAHVWQWILGSTMMRMVRPSQKTRGPENSLGKICAPSSRWRRNIWVS